MNDKHHIFSQLKDALHAHQEDYVPGAWEEFVQKRKRRRGIILFWRLSGAAAILLLLIGLFWFELSSPVKNEQGQLALQHAVRPSTQPSIKHDKVLTGDSVPVQKNQSMQNTVLSASAIAHNPATPKGNTANGNNAIATVFPDQKDNTDRKGNYTIDIKHLPADTGASKPVLANTEEKNTEVKKYARITKPIYDSLMGRHTITDPVKKEKRNLSYAAIVSPALGGQKLNFGAGFEIAYPITGNLSVSSGIAYSSLYAENNVDNSGGLARQIQGANLNVSGFELPLGLTYKTKSGFYATAGVLAMTVVSDHLEYNYLVQQAVATVSAKAGVAYQTVSLVSTRQTEPSQEKINNYLGFYQFSAGQKATIGHKEFNLGPFVKLPFGSVSNENIKLMQAGIRLGIGF